MCKNDHVLCENKKSVKCNKITKLPYLQNEIQLYGTDILSVTYGILPLTNAIEIKCIHLYWRSVMFFYYIETTKTAIPHMMSKL